MTEAGTPFTHSTPELYDRYMVPLLFEPYAKVVAERAASLHPQRILEIAAGTGIATRLLHRALPQAELVATDVSPVMLAVAAQHLGSVLGSPFRAEIERRDSSAIDRALDAVTAALAPWDATDAPMSAHVVTAVK